MPFKKGQSGNPAGVSKDRKFIDVLNRAIVQDDSKRLRSAAEKLLDLASVGEPWAIKEIADRLDGRPAQAVTVAGDAENPINMSMRVLFGRN
jgi:hypothetical protein